MNPFEIAGLAVLGGVILAGTVIKIIMRRKLRDMDGVSEVFLSDDGREHIAGQF